LPPDQRKYFEPWFSKFSIDVSTFGRLLGVTVVTSFCADYLVASIEETANRYHIPKAFIGLILLPLVVRVFDFHAFPMPML
jgi:Ca2+/H+ antiporter